MSKTSYSSWASNLRPPFPGFTCCPTHQLTAAFSLLPATFCSSNVISYHPSIRIVCGAQIDIEPSEAEAAVETTMFNFFLLRILFIKYEPYSVLKLSLDLAIALL